MTARYFHRVAQQTPTRFWINNPTREQADWAIADGAIGCTSNPSYSQKMLDHPAEGAYALALLDEAVHETPNAHRAAIVFQQKLVKPIAAKFAPIYAQTAGAQGYVSIQGDPIDEDDPAQLIAESLDNWAAAPNIACKIPATAPGLKAMETLIAQNVPINATEIFAVSQLITLCETYRRVSRETGQTPVLFMSHIAGIYDDFLQKYVADNQIDISPDVLHQAGLAAARKVYAVMEARGYPCVFVSGGSRGLHHFTELVGGRMCITINWEGTADKLLAQDPPVVERLFNPVPARVIDELCEKLPDFRRGYLDDGLSVDEYADFGPVLLFRSSFIKSWKKVLAVADERRRVLA